VGFDLRHYGIPIKLTTYLAGIPQLVRLTFRNETLQIDAQLYSHVEEIAKNGSWPWTSFINPMLPHSWITEPYIAELNHPHHWVQTSHDTYEIMHCNGWSYQVQMESDRMKIGSKPRRREVPGCLGISYSEDGGRYDDRLVTAVSRCGMWYPHVKVIEAPVSDLSNFSIIADFEVPQMCFIHMIAANRDLVYIPCGGLIPYYHSHYELIWDRSKQKLHTFETKSGAVTHFFKVERRGNKLHSWQSRLLGFDVMALRKLDGNLPSYHFEHCQYDLDISEKSCYVLDAHSYLNPVPFRDAYVGLAAVASEDWFTKLRIFKFGDREMEILAERDYAHVLDVQVVNDGLIALHKDGPSMPASLCRLDSVTLEDEWCVTMPIPINKVAHTMNCDDQHHCRASTEISIEEVHEKVEEVGNDDSGAGARDYAAFTEESSSKLHRLERLPNTVSEL
jgi:hypothetical protein